MPLRDRYELPGLHLPASLVKIAFLNDGAGFAGPIIQKGVFPLPKRKASLGMATSGRG